MNKLVAYLLPPLLLLGASGALAQSFKVIVHSSNPQAELSRAELADLFMKREEAWDHGPDALPIDQPVQSVVRKEFSKNVLGRDVSAIQSYWNRQIFSGRQVPPLQEQLESSIVGFVERNPGAIGYVSSATETSQVKIVRVVD